MSRSPSSGVTSSQYELHPRLERALEAHLRRPCGAPLHEPTVAAFEALQAQLGEGGPPLILDSGCGTGESTRRIARAWPGCRVIGVDKSLVRLRRTGAQAFPHHEGNAVWLQADLATFWRLAREAGWRLQRHYLLYPNPWPKPGQLARRWHAHPVFPQMLQLGGVLEMRCNWRVYAEEFAFSLNRLLGTSVRPAAVPPGDAISPFEAKYRASGHALYAVSASCAGGAV